MIDPVVDEAWLLRHRHEVVLLDVRWSLGGPPGRESYAEGHLPGAVFVDLDEQLAAPASAEAGRHPLPTPADFAAAMGSLGVGDGATVVAYDDSQGSSAARAVWMLRVIGLDAALLDGGLRGWSGPLETGVVTPAPASFTPVPWPAERVVDADTTADAARQGVPVLDARVPGRFTGEQPVPADPRPGHVPGAANAPWQANLDEAGRFRSPDELLAHYAALGVTDDASPVLYCGSGVTACLDLLALERAGVDGARLYPGSWSQWANEDERPVELS